MADDLDDVRALLPGVRVDRPEPLGGSDRSDVVRVRAQWPDAAPTTLIVKRYLSTAEGWVRESAALSVVSAEVPTCRVVAQCDVPPIVVLTDLGTGASVADALLGTDAAAGELAVLTWAEAVGALHRATIGAREQFRAAVTDRDGDLPVAHAAMSTAIDDGVAVLDDYCGRLDVVARAGAMRSLRELARRLGPDQNAALTPGDTCPDNNVLVDRTLHLIDFEGAQWRHIAWDVAYLSVPWPSCWCSWRMPGEVVERALERYRATVEDVVPYVRTPQFRRDVADAASGWAMISAAWFLPNALGDDLPPADPQLRTPSRRATILHRLDGVRRNEHLPEVAELAVRLRATLVERWGEVRLAYAPAFATDA